ncbi:MAG: hypothetical protein ABW046_14350 [Actinoplanes sp.]
MRIRILLAAAFAAVLVGLPAALSAAHLARSAQPEPDPQAVAAAVYPGVPAEVNAAGDTPGWLGFMNGRTHDAAPSVAPQVQPAGTEQALIAATRDRLAANGWRIGPGLADSYAFVATRDHTEVEFYAWDTDPDGLSTWAQVSKVPAWWVTAVAVLAGLTGTAFGGWLVLAGMQRLRERSPRARTAIRETMVVGLVLVVPALIQATGVETPGSVLIAYARWPGLLGLLLILAAAGTLARPGKLQDPPGGAQWTYAPKDDVAH